MYISNSNRGYTRDDYPKNGTMIEAYDYSAPITFDPKYGWLASGQFPAECIEACHHSGQCYEDCKHWRERLNFTVPRDLAIRYLREFGAWPIESDAHDTGLNQMSDEDLAIKVLWLACGDIQEQGEWLGLVH